MKALVTGHLGFVGRHLCPMLEAAGYEVTGTENFAAYVHNGDWTEHSLRMPRPVFDVIVHLGANIINVNDRMNLGLAAFNDIALDLSVCKWIEHHPPTKCFIAMSSCAIDFPEDPYCIIKRTLEAFALTLFKKGIPVVILRPYGGYGPDQSEEYPFRAIFERALRREDPLTVWGSGQIRDLIWIDDLCSGIMAAIDRFRRGGIHTLGTGIGTSFPQLAAKIAQAVGYNPKILCDETKATSGLIRRAEMCGQPAYQWWPTVSVDEGVAKAVEYFRSQGRL